MKFGFVKCFVFLILFIPLASFASTANISKIVFTTDPQTVLPNEISGAITIQLQNSSGSEEKLDGTADVTFESTSGTGEFLGSTGKAITKTMSTGSANKTFYYRDSTIGTYKITLTIKPRTGSGEWSGSQSIKIGQGSDDTTDTTNTDTNTDDTGNTDTTNNTESTNTTTENNSDSTTNTTDSNETAITTKTSSHSSSKKLSTYSKKSNVKVGAGRSRAVLVNTPIYFEPETSQITNSRSKKGDFIWSFGDGSSSYGRIVSHTYYFPGEYNVVLNTDQFGEEIVSRTKVKVIEPSVEITNVVTGDHGYVEIKNSSSMEVNINGWEIKSGKRNYIISEDTIINARSSIKIPNRVLGFDPVDEVTFSYPNEEVHMVYKPKKDEIQKDLAYIPAPVYYQTNYNEPKPKENISQLSTSTNSTSTIDQTASVGKVGIVSKF